MFAQDEVKDTLRTDEIIVIKPYTPSISDAFKIKNNPILENENITKDSVSYSFFSVPVASTFTPTKGKAQSVVKEPLDKIYDNFVAVGFGNYMTPYLETFLHSSSSRTNDFGAYIKHQSSGGGIEGVLVDDNYADTYLNLFYKQFERDYNWEANVGAQHEIYNWYGLPQEVAYSTEFLNTFDPKQSYLNIFLGGNLNFKNGIYKGGKIAVNNFSDDYKSNETYALITSDIEFPISSELLDIPIKIEYINGKFNQNYLTLADLKYSLLNIGISPSLEILRENLTVNLGARVYYSFDLESQLNKFYAYPNVTASYKLLEDILIGYAGITGDLYQNSYQDLTRNNPFVSPTLKIHNTDQKYNAYLGAKGKLSTKVGYDFRASYINENNKPLYVQNYSMTDGLTLPTYSYEAGNSFNIVYDDVETLSIYAELNVSISKEFDFGGTIEYNNFTTTSEAKAWNLPTIKSTIFVNYNSNNWYAGANIYYSGERFDFVKPYGEFGNIKVLDDFIDLNFNGGYVFTDRLTAYAKVNNVLSNNYQRYTNFDVQGIQVLGGIIYKFNF